MVGFFWLGVTRKKCTSISILILRRRCRRHLLVCNIMRRLATIVRPLVSKRCNSSDDFMFFMTTAPCELNKEGPTSSCNHLRKNKAKINTVRLRNYYDGNFVNLVFEDRQKRRQSFQPRRVVHNEKRCFL